MLKSYHQNVGQRLIVNKRKQLIMLLCLQDGQTALTPSDLGVIDKTFTGNFQSSIHDDITLFCQCSYIYMWF